MMSIKSRWANILCDQEMRPFKMIITDGEITSEIPISNCRLASVKRWAYELYNVSYKRILVTQVFDVSEENAKPI